MGIQDMIWYEKHRPTNLNQLVLPEKPGKAISKYIEKGSIPHLLFHGIQGSGKTSIARIIMNCIPCKKLILNASSKDRGVDTMKSTVVDFAKSRAIDGKIKIVLLDEADGLTPDAQRALKNTIEEYHKVCRFILTANDICSVIDPLKSRCIMFEFQQFPIDEAVKSVCEILKKEDVEYDRRKVTKLVKLYYPDFRSIMNAVQLASISGKFEPDSVGGANFKLSEFTDSLLSGDLRSIRESFVGMTNFNSIYKYLFDVFIMKVSDESRPEVALNIANHLANDPVVADREINMCSCLISIMMATNTVIKF